MDVVSQFVAHTPLWVFVLFAYLLSRGIKGLKPADITLRKLAIIPVALTVWSLVELVRLYGFALDAGVIWLVGTAVGFGIGFGILRGAAISVDPAGVIHRPADYTLLPLILLTFLVKYTFGAIAATSPELMMEPAFRFADLGLSGLFSGVFLGKFAVYLLRWRAAQNADVRLRAAR